LTILVLQKICKGAKRKIWGAKETNPTANPVAIKQKLFFTFAIKKSF